MEVSVPGSATQDQLCGLKVVTTTIVPAAVTDIEEFSAALQAEVVSSTGEAGAVIRITRFEQKIKLVTSVVGSSASDYDPAARTQFKLGVASTLGI
eukprot:COSAG04_NODE_7457_length_1126_cov_1.140214_2_plen_95_part_01